MGLDAMQADGPLFYFPPLLPPEASLIEVFVFSWAMGSRKGWGGVSG